MTLAAGMSLSVTSGFSANQSMNQLTNSLELGGRPAIDGASIVYRGVNGTSEQNLRKVIELMGGIEKIIGLNDVVLIKPNVQWWNQGAPNLTALKTFVNRYLYLFFYSDLVLCLKFLFLILNKLVEIAELPACCKG